MEGADAAVGVEGAVDAVSREMILWIIRIWEGVRRIERLL